MTREELRSECARARANRSDAGLDPDTAHLILVVPGRVGRRPFARKRVLPGLYGRAIGETADGGVVVDVTVTDIEHWLARAVTT